MNLFQILVTFMVAPKFQNTESRCSEPSYHTSYYANLSSWYDVSFSRI